MPARILDLIDFEKVNTLLEGFNKTTGFATAILDLEGNVLSKSGWRQICTEFHRIHPETAKKCLHSDTELANKMAEVENYHYYQCLNGLVDVAVPIVIKGEHIANLFSGQFFFEEPDDSFFQKQATKYGFNKEIYLKALKKVPVISKENVIVAMDFLLNMTQMISEMTFQKLEQIELNKSLRKSESHFRSIFENSFAVMLLIDPATHQIVDANYAAERFYGWSRSQLVLMTIGQINTLPSEELQAVMETARSQKRIYFKFKHRLADGSVRDVEVYSSKVEIDGKDYLYSIIHDITEQIKAEMLLTDSERKYRYLFENNPAPMWIYDLETLRFLEVNDTAIVQYGYCREEFLSMTLKNIRPEEDIDTLLKDIEQTVTPFNKAGIWRHIKKNGEIIFVEIISHRIEFEERPARLVIINDISERKKIEESLVESENSLKEAQIIANMGDWEFDLINNKSKWSENCYRLYDLEPFEIIPTYDYFRSRIHPDDLHLIDEGSTTILHTKSPLEQELRITFPDNRIKWILNKIIPTFSDNELVFLKGVNIDITEKREKEEQLHLLSKSIEQSPVSIVITDVNGTIEYVNFKFTENTGYTKEEALGNNPRVLKSGIHDNSFYKEMWKTILSGQPWIGEILNRKKKWGVILGKCNYSPHFKSKWRNYPFCCRQRRHH